MASIARTKNGTTRILFYNGEGYRKALYLGKCSKADSEKIKHRVESVLAAGILGRSIDQEDATWLATFPKVREKFELVGLIQPTEPAKEKESPTLAEFLKGFVERYGSTKKPATRVVWQQVIDTLVAFMPKGIRMDAINTGHCRDFVEKMRRKKMADSTIHKRLTFCRQFFKDAVEWKVIIENPFTSIKVQRGSELSNVFVSRQTIDALMAKANTRWQVIIALARYGGLRTPSETLSIKWADIDWESGRMHVPEPKMEHHKGRGVRVCPLFPELRRVLEKARAEAPQDAEFVVDAQAYRDAAKGGNGWSSANLRTQFIKSVLKKAKVEPWVRLFHSMRASRQTELLHEYPIHVVCRWLGNSPEVARKHYALTTEEDFAKAASFEGALNTTRAEPDLVQNERGSEESPNGAEEDSTKENAGETDDFPQRSSNGQWRRRELNPRPVMLSIRHLHV